jgi:phosphatidylserine decarboxylase
METTSPASRSDVEDSADQPGDFERVINIKECPLCRRPRLGKRSEQDIITHLAVCASSDWSRVNRLVTANYVTSSQAQRKLVTKLINKVAIGSYSVGANSANILVQDRLTGQLQEEKMAVYVRLGIRVLYKGARGQMGGARARKLLRSLSVKQGVKYDSPSSAAEIPGFILFHNLNVAEILDPLDSFKTFNQFFYRKLKSEARPLEEPDNDARLVSMADSRMLTFETVNDATQIWIKGRDFTVSRLLGPVYRDQVSKYEGGALCIFRLAPQDYHRFHSPVAGTIGKITPIDGEYYTVNPQAVRTSLDVYGENVRMIVPIETEEFGTVMTVWVGAMMVGSIISSVKEGDRVERKDELGYFAFGGSTIVVVFEKGRVQWDNDLLQNSSSGLESLVRVGMGIGRARPAPTPIPAAIPAPASSSAV